MDSDLISDVQARNRWLLFSVWIGLCSLIFFAPLWAFIQLVRVDSDASYVVLVPFLVGAVFFLERHRIFRDVSSGWSSGLLVLVVALCAAAALRFGGDDLSEGAKLSGGIFVLALLWLAGFLVLFGTRAAKAGCFPLLFLFLMVPLPPFLIDHTIYLLQLGSAWTTGELFDLLGVPYLREGFVFHLAQINIEIAKECSGIRSSMALLILALLITHFCLRSFWRRAVFLVFGIFMMILKNGIRIAALTLLAIHVDPGFLTGRLHHEGGVVFFLIGLTLLAPVLWLLRRNESSQISGIPVRQADTRGPQRPA